MNQQEFHGFYRAKVVDDKDPDKYGRVLVWIPALMPEIDSDTGLWANPANNPIGGRNTDSDSDHHYMGSCLIPQKGSWVFVFFESGNPNRPFYFGSLDLQNTHVLPECQFGENYEKKWVLFKSHSGRTIVISDDPDDERIEITGKKRQIKNPPTGDIDSVFQIDGNQTTILFDERIGKEKILIRTHKGDFLHIDIDEQSLYANFANDIILEAGREIIFKAGSNITMRAEKNIDGLCGENVNMTANTGDVNISVKEGHMNTKVFGNINTQAVSGAINNKSSVAINNQSTDGIITNKSKLGIVSDATNGPVSIKSSGDMAIESGGSFDMKATGNLNAESAGDVNVKASGNVNTDGAKKNDQMGMAQSAGAAASLNKDVVDAKDANIPLDANPDGLRNT